MRELWMSAIIASLLAAGVLSPAHACAPTPAGIAGWWKAEGNTIDAWAGRNGALKNGATYGSGNVGQAFALDGVDDFVDIADASALNPGTGDFAVSFWVNFDTTAGEQVLVEKFNGPTGWTLTKLPSNSILFTGSGMTVQTGAISLPTGTWIHVVARRKAGGLSLRVNNVLYTVGGVFTADASSPSTLKFGHRGSPSDTPGSSDSRGFFLAGRIDEVMYFVGAAPDDATIAAIYAAGPDGVCVPTPVCGNGRTELGEVCDDGNLVGNDGCENDCTSGCGNGVLGGSEVCDDGNLIEGDGCDTNCTVSTCGNAVQSPGEGCDDGNPTEGDGCDTNCTPTGCGNGIVTAGEPCDDGNPAEGDGCDTNCSVTSCGNGIQTSGESCDDGNFTNWDGCQADCTITLCGNGTIESGLSEVCDDGNQIDGDGCDRNCTPTACGNGIASPGEVCDDGNPADGDGCDTNCTPTGCNNGIVTAGEPCDDGNAINEDGCNVDCTLSCGNATLGGTEQCDDGNRVDWDGCQADCTTNLCGNGAVDQAWEECDDGNHVDSDGCDADCKVPVCGNGIRNHSEPCDDGNQGNGDGCDNNCSSTGCRNGIVTSGEECDDGNAIADDGCSSSCLIETCAPRPAGLTAWWTGDGTTAEVMASRNATLRNGATYAAGRVVQGFALDGIDDYVDVPHDPAIDVGSSSFSLMFWVKFDSTAGDQVLAEKYVASGSPTGWSLMKTAANALRFTSPGGTFASGSLSLPTGTWLLVGVGRQGLGVGITLGSTVVASGGVGGNIGSGASLKFGHRGSPSDTPGSTDSSGMYLKGKIDEVMLNVGVPTSNAEGTQIALAGSRGACLPTSSCGNLRIDTGEVCDDGNVVNGDGCDNNCELTSCGNGILTAGEPCDDGNHDDWDGGCQGDCSLTGCDNGVVEAGEVCDDGNLVDGDGCDRNCTATSCGNRMLSPGETCDDGNIVDDDGCDSNCLPTACGNGVVTSGETCDDSNVIDDDGCDSNCRPTACGNGVVTSGETCDDGNLGSGDGCDSNCLPTACGNGVVAGDETCDDGNIVDDDGCDSSCRPTGCGSGVVTGGETCDDSNLVDDDGCDSSCRPTGCGSGVVTSGETCDDSNLIDDDGCDSNCQPTGCGNGVVTSGEGCDDGNLVDEDGCEADCTLSCGNGVMTGAEQCDDGNRIDWDGCQADCTVSLCGNGVVDGPGEACDDGNAVDGDACDRNCTFPACGNGIADPGEECEDGNLANDDGCDRNCTFPGCGNGVRNYGELCDDGNVLDGDDCEHDCVSPPGLLDPSFDLDGASWTDIYYERYDASVIPGVAVLPDGRIVAGMNDDDYRWAGGDRFALACFQPDGSLDPAFGNGGTVKTALGQPGTDATMRRLTVQADGKILAVGSSVPVVNSVVTILRYLADGTLDPSFGSGGVAVLPDTGANAYANDVAVDSTGAILVAGGDGNGALLLARLLPGGALDATFHAGTQLVDPASPAATSLAVLPDRSVVTAAPGDGVAVVSRYTAAGAGDTTFGDLGRTVVITGGWPSYPVMVAAGGDGKLVLATSGGLEKAFATATIRMEPDGTLDPTYDGDGVALVDISRSDEVPRGLLVGSDGSVTVSGYVEGDGFFHEVMLVRFRTDGRLDRQFNGKGWVTTALGNGQDDGGGLAVQNDGKILVAARSGSSPTTDPDLVVLRYLVGTCGDRRAQTDYGEQCDDGNEVAGDGCEPDCTSTPVAQVAAAGGTVTTDPLGLGASPEAPVQSEITTPDDGLVSIAAVPPEEPPSDSGLVVVGVQLQIEAPPATAQVPLVIALSVDASALPPGVDGERLVVMRDGQPVADCTGPVGEASPDPCIRERVVDGAGDVHVTVLTSHASLWGMAVRGLESGEQGCVQSMAKATAAVAKAQGKVNTGCLKSAWRTVGFDFEGCVQSGSGAVDGARGQVAAVAADACSPSPPFGFAGADAASDGAQSASQGLVYDLFGTAPSSAVSTLKSDATCQAALLKSTQKLFLMATKEVVSAVTEGIRRTVDPMVNGEDLGVCQGAPVADPRGKVAKAVAGVAKALTDKCPADISGLAPGACATSSDVPGCVQVRVVCETCLMFRTAQGLDLDCDTVDDAVINSSCP